MNIVEKFCVIFDQGFLGKIRQFVQLQCAVEVGEIVGENKLAWVGRQLAGSSERVLNKQFKDTCKSINLSAREQGGKQSRKQQDTCKSINLYIKQHELASTSNSMTRSGRVSLIMDSSKKITPLTNNPVKNVNSSDLTGVVSPAKDKKSFKHNRIQTLQDMRIVEQNAKNDKELDISEVRSLCDYKSERKGKVLPCYRNIVTV